VKLFVYGTLMRGMPFPMATFLEQHATFVCEGVAQGRLYELGGYPGLVHLSSEARKVLGHIFELSDAEHTLAALDAYEMINAAEPESSEYRRETIPVNTANGVQECLVYLYNRPTVGLPEIPFGNWPAWFHSRENPIDPASFRGGREL